MALCILVVDDSEMVRRILRMLLGSRDWTICEADSGRDGIAKFRKLKPDVVVLDLAMPDMTGIEAAKVMSNSDSKIPIVLFTILEIGGIERAAAEAGICAIVPKNNAWSLIPQIEKVANLPSSAA
jgi:two-component system chemotaxis response regulator CheY